MHLLPHGRERAGCPYLFPEEQQCRIVAKPKGRETASPIVWGKRKLLRVWVWKEKQVKAFIVPGEARCL